MLPIFIIAGWGVLLVGIFMVAVRASARLSSVARLDEATREIREREAAAAAAGLASGPLRRWLVLAGYRGASAATIFLVIAAVAAALGFLMAAFVYSSGLTEQASAMATGAPSGLGDMATPVLKVAPFLTGILLAALPWVMVRSVRRTRVREMEEDLPTILELLATLGEAGLGFDAALGRIQDAHLGVRPMSQELRLFQLECLTGVPRVQAYRRLAERCAVSSVSTFTSAMVQAEQVGSGVTGVLRRQADDLRNRRKERALRLAEALPVKLVFPLVACFLPGIFLATLGPAFFQFMALADNIVKSAPGSAP